MTVSGTATLKPRTRHAGERDRGVSATPALRCDRSRPIIVCCNDGMSTLELPDLADIEAIKQVKYQYLRALDTKHWDDFADTLAEDIKADYGPSIGAELHFTNRADLVDYMRTSLGPNVITEHRVTHPEITVTGD